MEYSQLACMFNFDKEHIFRATIVGKIACIKCDNELEE